MSELAEFRALGISDISLEALRKKGFEEPSAIQKLTIPLLLTGEKDLIGQAQTGTGKTAAFGLPIIELLPGGSHTPEALILAPTRELCLQIAEELNSLKGEHKLEIVPLYGGQSIELQLRSLKRGVDIAVGTPGRIIDLLDRHALSLDKLQVAILDEADEMLNMGFVEDIEEILKHSPTEKRMLMFSATMPKEILSIAETFMRPGYEIIRTETERLAVELTEQIYFEVHREDKLEALSRIIDMTENLYAMVFCRTRNDVDELTEKLLARGYAVEALHGDIAQAQRTRVINGFKAKKFNILIATDVAARGIDVNNLSHVINYSIPQGTEAYVHRIGRTGRAGKEGTAITFVTPAEFRQLTRIKREANADIRRETLPQAEEVANAKRERVCAKILQTIAEEKNQDYLSYAEELLTTVEHPAEVISALLYMKYKKELMESSYGEIGVNKRERKAAPDERGQTRLFMGIGRKQNAGPAEILDLIWEKCHIRKSMIGRIDIFEEFSFINVGFETAEAIIRTFQGSGTVVEQAKESEKKGPARNGRRNEDKSKRQRLYPDRGGYQPRNKRFVSEQRQESNRSSERSRREDDRGPAKKTSGYGSRFRDRCFQNDDPGFGKKSRQGSGFAKENSGRKMGPSPRKSGGKKNDAE